MMKTDNLFKAFGILWVTCATLGIAFTILLIYILFQVAVYLDHINHYNINGN